MHKDKCNFQKTSLDFLGFNISERGVRPLSKKVEAITAFPPPKNPKDLLGFLGALNYYRRNLPKLDNKSAAEVLKMTKDAYKYVDIHCKHESCEIIVKPRKGLILGPTKTLLHANLTFARFNINHYLI